MSNRHVVVISVDAMVYEDLETLSKMSVLKDRWSTAARVDRVKSVYPTITYPCHSTMMTGVYPEKHQILNNEQPNMCEKSSLWQHMRESVKAESIFDAAKRAGLTTAAVFWPVTGNDKNIDYLVDEYWPQTPDESTHDCFIHSGSSPETMREVVEPNLHWVEGHNRQHPWADAFVISCACDILRKFKPNLLMIHPANVDAYRHETGLFTEKVTQGLYETNLWLEQLIQAAEQAGIAQDTDFFIVSDHGQMSIRRCVALNVLLKENGLIDVNDKGEITSWRAFARSGGLSALIYLKDPENKADWQATKDVLDRLCKEEVYGFSRVYTEEEARREEHLGGPFSFVLETDGYTTFSNDWMRPLVKPLDNRNYRFGRASHGHLPSKGPTPTLVAFGPHIKPGAVLDRANLVDEAPTFARVLGLTMPEAAGVSLDGILTNL